MFVRALFCSNTIGLVWPIIPMQWLNIAGCIELMKNTRILLDLNCNYELLYWGCLHFFHYSVLENTIGDG